MLLLHREMFTRWGCDNEVMRITDVNKGYKVMMTLKTLAVCCTYAYMVLEVCVGCVWAFSVVCVHLMYTNL